MTTLNVQNQVSSGMPATSGTWTFSVVRDDILIQAMRNLGLLEESEVPTSKEMQDCARILNMIVKQLAGNLDKAPGFKMYQRKRAMLFLGNVKPRYALGGTGDNWVDSTVGLQFPEFFGENQLNAAAAPGATVLPFASTLTPPQIGDYVGVVVGADIFWTTCAASSSTSVTIPSPGLPAAANVNAFVYNYTVKAQRPMKIVSAVLVDVQDTKTPLTEMTVQQYDALPTTISPGYQQDPTAFYYEAQMDNNQGLFYIDCYGAQDVTKQIMVTYLREAMDFNNPGDAPEFPQEWFLDLTWEVSLQICGMFDGDWTLDRQAAYSVAVTRAKEGVPEVSADYFQVDDPDGY